MFDPFCFLSRLIKFLRISFGQYVTVLKLKEVLCVTLKRLPKFQHKTLKSAKFACVAWWLDLCCLPKDAVVD